MLSTFNPFSLTRPNKSWMQEWSINHGELNFGKVLRHGRNYSIHEGHWHGDIYIYKLNLDLTTRNSTSSSCQSTSSSGLGSSIASDVFSFDNSSSCLSTPSSCLGSSISSDVFSFDNLDDEVFDSATFDNLDLASRPVNSNKKTPTPTSTSTSTTTTDTTRLSKFIRLSRDSCYSSSSCWSSPATSPKPELTLAQFGQMAQSEAPTTLVATATTTTTTTTTTTLATSDNEQKQSGKFWHDLAKLCSVAHENFVLFMGACLDPDNVSIIMGKCNGPTLYQCLHQPDDRLYQSRYHCLNERNKRNIGQQITLGMAYLHAKDIVHGRLTSMNIILDYRVKICLLDHGMPELEHHSGQSGGMARGQLTYMSPELVRELYVHQPHVECGAQATKQSDVYAIGSLLYELFTEEFPHTGLTSDQLIWRVGAGAYQENFANVNHSIACDIKEIIRECWSYSPCQRPTFAEINMALARPQRQKQDNISSSLSMFDQICIRKKQIDSPAKRLFSSRESMF